MRKLLLFAFIGLCLCLSFYLGRLSIVNELGAQIDERCSESVSELSCQDMSSSVTEAREKAESDEEASQEES